MNQHCSAMKNVITAILRKRGVLDRFQASSRFHLRIEKEGFLPLVIKRQHERITVTHYREGNGDPIADPDMEFKLTSDGRWYPVALQLWNGYYLRARWVEGGHEFLDLNQVRAQLSFARMWARNLREQGW